MTHQPTFAEAAAKADTGMQQSTDHADRVSPDWSARAYQVVRLTVCEMPESQEFTFEQLRVRARRHFREDPCDLRAWGSITRRAIKDGIIVPTGRYAPRLSGNCTPTMTYVRGEW